MRRSAGPIAVCVGLGKDALSPRSQQRWLLLQYRVGGSVAGGSAIKVQLRPQPLERLRPDQSTAVWSSDHQTAAATANPAEHRCARHGSMASKSLTEVLQQQSRCGSLQQDLEAIGGPGGLPHVA